MALFSINFSTKKPDYFDKYKCCKLDFLVEHIMEHDKIRCKKAVEGLGFLFIISALAGTSLKSQNVYFFQYNSWQDTE